MKPGGMTRYRAPMDDLRAPLRAALTVAMKARDRAAVSALRSAIAAIDNAEAVEVTEAVASSEVDRRVVDAHEIERIVTAEIADLLRSAEEYERLGQAERAEELRTGAAAIAAAISTAIGERQAP